MMSLGSCVCFYLRIRKDDLSLSLMQPPKGHKVDSLQLY